jgi:hypothetical protein
MPFGYRFRHDYLEIRPDCFIWLITSDFTEVPTYPLDNDLALSNLGMKAARITIKKFKVGKAL